MPRAAHKTAWRPAAGLVVALAVGVSILLRTIDRPATRDARATPASTSVTTGAAAPAAPPTTAPVLPLQEVVDRFVAGHSVPFSVMAVHLPTGTRAAHLEGRQVLSASLYKLFVAAELLRRTHDGSLRADAPADDGSGRRVSECIRAMIVVSDNRCGAWGLSAVGAGALDRKLAQDGFAGTSLASPQRTTAADVARFLERARAGTLLGPGGEAATAELYGLLAAQQVNDRFPIGVPAGTALAHKTGDRLHWAHDAGILTTPGGELLLVVLSGPWPAPCCDADHPGPAEARAFAAIAALARESFRVVSP